MKAITIELLNEYASEKMDDYEIALARAIEAIANDGNSVEAFIKTDMTEEEIALHDGEALLYRLKDELVRLEAIGDAEAWEDVYSFFSDVSKDVYGYRVRLHCPFRK